MEHVFGLLSPPIITFLMACTTLPVDQIGACLQIASVESLSTFAWNVLLLSISRNASIRGVVRSAP